MAVHAVHPFSPDDRLTNAEAAQILGVDAATLTQWRYLQKFSERLPYLKVGRKVFYRKSDLLNFLQGCVVGGTKATEAE